MPTRSVYFDLWRAAAIVRVIVYHSLGLAWLTVAFPAVGLMFALAGSLMAASLDRSGPAAVGGRLRRLLPPVWLLAAISVPAMLLTGLRLNWSVLLWLFPLHDPPANTWGAASLGMIWYLREYLWFVLLSPLALAAFRRWPVITLLTPLGLLVGLTLTGVRVTDILADLALYGDCWLLGFAHHDGHLRRLGRRAVLCVAGTLAATGAAWILTHPGHRGYDLNDIPLGNALWSAAFLLVVLGVVPTGRPRERPRLSRLLRAVNGRVMTLYLWHQTAIVITVTAIGRWGLHFTGLSGRLVVLSGVVTLLAVAVLGFGWVEDVAARRRPALLPATALTVPRRR